MGSLSGLSFDNHYARLGNEFSTRRTPAPLPAPYLVSANAEVAALLDLDPAALASPEFVQLGSGNWLPPGAEPVAMRYAGHRFGTFVPQADDERTILIGQLRNARGESWDLQLDGSGTTADSQGAEGRTTLGSAIREYLGSEALHQLGIPTTRSVGVIGSDDRAHRGGAGSAAALLRVARSHVRFGSFEMFFYRDQHDNLRKLVDYVIAHDFSELTEAPGSTGSHLGFLREVVVRTAHVIARWQTAGFVHGLMNTDSMSILGLTFDFGAFGFIERYDPDFICNDADESGRYAFSQQPIIAYWNLCALAQALTPLLSGDQCREALAHYEPAYRDEYARLFRAKLGLYQSHDEDGRLINDLLDILAGNEVDYPLFFRTLGTFDPDDEYVNEDIGALFHYPEAFELWSAGYRERLQREGVPQRERAARMRATNPRYVLRNWIAERAIERAKSRDFSEIDNVMRVLRRPFDEQPGFDEYTLPAPQDMLVQSLSCAT